jgi:hypothetical protein
MNWLRVPSIGEGAHMIKDQSMDYTLVEVDEELQLLGKQGSSCGSSWLLE